MKNFKYTFFKKNKVKKDTLKHFELYKNYDLILHIGSPKSGTSALQNFFLKNRKELGKKNIFYPLHGKDKNGISGGHSQLAIALMENRINDAKDLFESWYSEAKYLKQILLLSSESFFNISKKMEPLFKNKKVLVVAYHREISEYIISVHNQLIKRHYSTQNLNHYVDSILSNSHITNNLVNKSFSKIYEEWKSIVGTENLIIRAYKKESFFDNKIEKDFINRIGLSFYGFVLSNKKINISYTNDALELKRMINCILDETSNLNHKIDLTLQGYSEQQKNTTINNTIDSSLLLKLQSAFADEEEIIQNTYIENSIKIKQINRIKNNTFPRKNIDTKSLKKVWIFLIKDKEIKMYLKRMVLKKLEAGFINYSIFRLAEFFDIPNLENYEIQYYWFNQNQLKNMTSDRYQKADFLRDIATLLLDRGDIKNADKIISKALELRPQGSVIINIKEQIMNFKCQT